MQRPKARRELGGLLAKKRDELGEVGVWRQGAGEGGEQGGQEQAGSVQHLPGSWPRAGMSCRLGCGSFVDGDADRPNLW